jgi:hypothetical protein
MGDEDAVRVLEEVRRIMDEPIDESSQGGRTRAHQYLRIDALLAGRDAPTAP